MTAAMTVARERQLDWLLGETLGGVTATAHRAAGRRAASVFRQRLFAAAILTLAAGAAFGVAWLREDDAAKTLQQPQGEPAWREVRDVRQIEAMPADVRALRCFDFDDAAIAALTKFEKLEQLDLSAMAVNEQGYSVSLKITDAGLAPLGKLTKLRWLSLATCHEVKGTGLTALENLPQLEHLDLTYTGVESPAVERLQRLPSLRVLSLAYCMNFHGRSLAEVAKIPGLRRLLLQGCTTLAADDVVHLAKLRELDYLDLRDCQGRFRGQTELAEWNPAGGEPPEQPKQDGVGITDASVAALAGLKLETLLLGGCESLTDAIGDTLVKMTTLRDLDLSNLPKTTDALLAKVPGDLTRLILEENGQFDGAALRRLPALSGLREFGLSGIPNLSSSTLMELLANKSLETLRLGGLVPTLGMQQPTGWAMKDEVATVLASQRSLRSLDLSNVKWPGAATMAALAQLPQLVDLDLKYWPTCSAQRLAPLGASRSLRSIRFAMCREIDVAAVRVLATVPLRELDLYGTNLKRADVEELAKAWPGCVIKLPGGQRHVVPK